MNGVTLRLSVVTICSAVYGVRCVPLRFTNVYGPGMTGKDSIVARIMRAAVSDGGMTVYGAGEQVRDYVYVEDVAGAITLALRNSDICGPVVIGAGSSYSVLDILALARSATGARTRCGRSCRGRGQDDGSVA